MFVALGTASSSRQGWMANEGGAVKGCFFRLRGGFEGSCRPSSFTFTLGCHLNNESPVTWGASGDGSGEERHGSR